MGDRRFLARVGGYLAAGILLGVGATVGDFAGTVLIVAGLLVVAALLVTFRLR